MKQITKQEINKLDKHLQGLEDNWLSDEMNSAEIYQAEIDKDFDKEYDLIDETIVTDGDLTIVKPGKYHEFEALEDTIAYEIYWVELNHDDIVRENVGGMPKK